MGARKTALGGLHTRDHRARETEKGCCAALASSLGALKAMQVAAWGGPAGGCDPQGHPE